MWGCRETGKREGNPELRFRLKTTILHGEEHTSLSNQWCRQRELEISLALTSLDGHPGPVSLLDAACVRRSGSPCITLELPIPACQGVPRFSLRRVDTAGHLPMKRELTLRRWAALAYVLLLLCPSPTLSMALCVHRSRHLRSARYALGPAKATAVEASSSITSPRRKGLRRGRSATMLHSDAYAGSTSTSAHVHLSPLPTAMDRVLPFGRCVGVALPVALTDEVMRAAEEELLPEEMSYCAGLPKTLQVSDAGRKVELCCREVTRDAISATMFFCEMC